MRTGTRRRTTLAALAAIAGTGFSSGRVPALCFGQLGGAKWLAAMLAMGLYWAMYAGVLWLVGTGGMRRGATVYLRAIAGALIAALLLDAAGRTGALALPLRDGYACGCAMAAWLAMAFALMPRRALPVLGFMSAGCAVLFFAGLAADPRPVKVFERGETELRLAGSAWAAVVSAVCCASVNACAAAWPLRCATEVPTSTDRGSIFMGDFRECLAVASRVTAIFAVVIALGLLALDRGGVALMAREEPLAPLSARWGKAGYWLCVGFRGLCETASLSAAASALRTDLMRGGPSRAAALYAIPVGAVLFAALASTR